MRNIPPSVAGQGSPLSVAWPPFLFRPSIKRGVTSNLPLRRSSQRSAPATSNLPTQLRLRDPTTDTAIMATDEPSTSATDETPISPVERVNSLEKHLQTRPEAQDLKNRNILHDTSAAPYVVSV